MDISYTLISQQIFFKTAPKKMLKGLKRAKQYLKRTDLLLKNRVHFLHLHNEKTVRIH